MDYKGGRKTRNINHVGYVTHAFDISIFTTNYSLMNFIDLLTTNVFLITKERNHAKTNALYILWVIAR